MKKIDLKRPKYALPLIVLPFIFLFNYLYLEMSPAVEAKPGQKHAFQETDEIITALPEANLEKKDINNKLGAGLEKHKHRTDYSAVREMEEEEEQQKYGSIYTDEEKRIIDSMNTAILTDKKNKEFMDRVQERQNTDRQRYVATTPAASSQPRVQKTESAYQKEMRLFKEQMRFVDSLGKAGQEPDKSTVTRTAAAPKKEIKEEAPEPLNVRKTANPNTAYFNTVKNDGQEQFIKAMLDEGLKVREGGRIRIRLLDDIYVSDYEIEKGSYLYGIVSGFKAQRVEITISSLLYGNQIIPVNLSIYDRDGLAGLYVPGSQFRDFTKEVAANTSSGQSINFDNGPENTNQMLFSMMDKMAQTTSKAVGRTVKQNKAKLKYNTIVFLIDNKAQKN